jgi:GST-like protein
MSLVLYACTTPNGRKISIMLEELGLPYEVRAVDISRDQQFALDFLEISPNNKILALVDDAAEGGPLAVFESGAILTWLAERTERSSICARARPSRRSSCSSKSDFDGP